MIGKKSGRLTVASYHGKSYKGNMWKCTCECGARYKFLDDTTAGIRCPNCGRVARYVLFGRVGFISGFTGGGCYVKDIENSYITIPNKTYKQVSFKHLEFINHNNNWQFISHL